MSYRKPNVHSMSHRTYDPFYPEKRPPYGYRYTVGHSPRLVIDPQEQQVIQLLKALYDVCEHDLKWVVECLTVCRKVVNRRGNRADRAFVKRVLKV